MTDGEYPYPPVQSDPAYATMKRAVWPMVIGIVCIVLGSLGLICYGCQGVGTVVMFSGATNLPPEFQNARPPQPVLIGNMVNACVSFILSLWLLLAGVALTMRRPGARSALMAWSVCKIIVVIGITIHSIIYVSAHVQHMNQQQGPFPQMTEALMIVTLLIQGMIYLIWPVFLLIWFMIPKFKNEVESWRTSPMQEHHPMVYDDAPQQWI